MARKFRRDYRTNTLGNWITSSFYDAVGEKEKADEVWRDLLTCSTGYAYCAIGHFHATCSSDEMLQMIDTLDTKDPLIRVAKAYVLADIPERRDEARQIYDMVIEQRSSLFVRQKAILILLLLGETDEARRQCREWAEEYRQRIAGDDITRSVAHEDLALEIVADPDYHDPSDTGGARLASRVHQRVYAGSSGVGRGRSIGGTRPF